MSNDAPPTAQPNRRDFLTTAAAVAVALPVLSTAALGRDKPVTPDTPVDVGTLADYAKDGVTDKWAKSAASFFVVRQDGKLIAVSSICTHRFCPVSVQGGEYYCKCHRSHFTLDGSATEGPATHTGSLPHYGIRVDAKGRLIVEPGKAFSEAKWDDAASFVKV